MDEALLRQILSLVTKLMATTDQVLDTVTALSAAVSASAATSTAQTDILQAIVDGQVTQEQMALDMARLRETLEIFVAAALDAGSVVNSGSD